MSWAIHCREERGDKSFGLYSTVVMGYLTPVGMTKEAVVLRAYLLENKHRESLVKQFGEKVCPWKPSRKKWLEIANFAEQYGNSEYFHYSSKAASHIQGCRCHYHQPIPNELHNGWW